MRHKTSSGQSLVEVAFVLPVLLIVLLGIFDFGRAIYAYNAVSNAAREAARIAIVDQNASVIVAEGKSAALGLPADAVNVTFVPPTCAKIGCTVTVTVDHEWQAITPLFPPIQFESTTDVPIERVYVSP